MTRVLSDSEDETSTITS